MANDMPGIVHCCTSIIDVVVGAHFHASLTRKNPVDNETEQEFIPNFFFTDNGSVLLSRRLSYIFCTIESKN